MVRKTTKIAHELGYRVSNMLLWQVPVFRYRVVRKTEKHVVYLDAVGKEVKEKLVTDGHWWFFTFSAAKRHAKMLLDERREKLQKITALLKSSELDLRQNVVKDVEPIPMPKGKIRV